LHTIYTEIHAYLENPTEQQREDLKAKAKKQGKAGFKTICINYKWLKDNGLEEALFYNPGKEIEKAYKTKEITREEMLNNPLKAVYEKYVLPISYGLVEMEYPAAALAALDKTQPDYEQAIKKAEKIAESFLKAIQEKTGCTPRQLAIISKDYIWRIYADCYNIYHKPEYEQLSLAIKEYTEKTAEIENRIKDPVTDKENDIFYSELDELEKEFNRLSEIHYYKTHQIEEAREKTKEILQRIFPGKADLIRAEISIADKINPLGNYIFLPNNSIHQLIKQTLNSPQKVAAVDVRKSITFCHQLKVPVLGVIENMSGFVCPHCGKTTDILNSGGGARMAEEMKVPFLGAIPIDPQIVQACDDGTAFISRFAESPTAQIMHRITQPIIALDQHK